MGKTLTLKNLPDELHARLSAAAKRHRRSLNQEAIVCLESGLGAPPLRRSEFRNVLTGYLRRDLLPFPQAVSAAPTTVSSSLSPSIWAYR